MITVPHASIQSDVANSKTELRCKKLLSSVELTKDFFYSYTYPIMQSLQKNVLSSGEEGVPYDNIFVWNAYLTQPIRSRCNNSIWTLALVHWNFKQIKLSIYGRDFSVTLVSRRSRHFAGTREASLRDLRAYSLELSRGESPNDILSALANREKEIRPSQQYKDDETDISAPRYQNGVQRTNCIDCLDRTNVAQYAYGLAALGRQLHVMGLSGTSKIDPDSSIAAALMDMYQSIGRCPCTTIWRLSCS